MHRSDARLQMVARQDFSGRRAVEPGQRLRQAVTAAAHLENFQAGAIESAQRVPHRGPRYAKCARHRLAGAEFAIGEQAQCFKGQRRHVCNFETIE